MEKQTLLKNLLKIKSSLEKRGLIPTLDVAIEDVKEDRKSEIIESLSDSEEAGLQEQHMSGYMGTDDNAPDAFEAWLMNLSYDELIKLLGRND